MVWAFCSEVCFRCVCVVIENQKNKKKCLSIKNSEHLGMISDNRSTVLLALTANDVWESWISGCIQPAAVHPLGEASLSVDAGLSPHCCQKGWSHALLDTGCYPVKSVLVWSVVLVFRVLGLEGSKPGGGGGGKACFCHQLNLRLA